MAQVNVGTIEKPIMVPEQATKPTTDEGREWWEMVAVGSITVSQEVLAALEKYLKTSQKRD